MNIIDIDSYNLCLLNFSDIFKKCESDILDDLYKFNLLEGVSFQNKDTKKIIYHHLIYQLCETVIHQMTFNKIIVIYNIEDLTNNQLIKYSSKPRTISFLTNTLNKIKNILPVRLFASDISFNEIKEIIDNDNGEKIELLTKLQLCNNGVPTFQKVKNFARRYGLSFLSLDFFNRVRTKNLLFS